MKTRVFKAASLLLTISLLIISLSFMVSAADNEFTEKWQLVTTTPTVVRDGNNPQTVTIQMIVKDPLTCYALQGAWDIADSTGNITLTGDVVLNASLPADPNNYAYGAAAGGEMMWVNGQINSPVTLPQGYVFMTATYTVAANTPSGMYKIGFAKTVYAGTDAEPDETSETLEIVIEVVGHTCTFAKYEFDEDSHWQVCECGKMIDNTDWDHDFTNGDCVCGAKKPATGLKGDIDLDGEVGPSDLTALAKHLAEIEFITDATAAFNADVTGDDEIGPDDLTKLAQYMAEIIDSLD